VLFVVLVGCYKSLLITFYCLIPNFKMLHNNKRTKSPKSPNSPGKRFKLHPTLKAFANSQHRASGSNIIEDEEIVAERQRSFIYSKGLTSEEAHHRLEKFGRNELPETVIPKWYIFVSQLWQPMPIMIWIAAIIEAGISNFIDMAILLFIIFANASISFYEITKAGDAVAALKKSLKPLATVKRDGVFSNCDAAIVVPGDLVLLASGSAVPADCRVNEGEIEVDESSLTGESLPVTKFQGSVCLMGSTVVRGEVEGTVESTGANTFFGKTAALLGVSSIIKKHVSKGINIIFHCAKHTLLRIAIFRSE
jgi:magnesium-transporting ATPase (P-type)